MNLTIENPQVHTLPLTLTFEDGSPEAFKKYYTENKEFVEESLLHIGAIHVRGINVNTVEKFSELMKFLCPVAPDFLDGNSPRGKYASNVYNASEYDANSIVRLHTEFSYSNLYPKKIFFCCIQPAATGGQTTVGDAAKPLELLEPEIVEEFERKGITYIRNLHSGSGLGPSWQEAFETKDRNFMEQYCKENDIQYEWLPGDIVRLTQTRTAVQNHPITGAKLWFKPGRPVLS